MKDSKFTDLEIRGEIERWWKFHHSTIGRMVERRPPSKASPFPGDTAARVPNDACETPTGDARPLRPIVAVIRLTSR